MAISWMTASFSENSKGIQQMTDQTRTYPNWLLLIGVLVIAFAHTQVTLRHLALRVAGIRFGEAHQVLDVVGYLDEEARFDTRKLKFPSGDDISSVLIVRDKMGVYLPGELAGDRIWFDGIDYEVVDNTETNILVDTDDASAARDHIQNTRKYMTGIAKKGLIANAALRVPAINFTLADVFLGLLICGLAYWLIAKRQLPAKPILPPAMIAFLLIAVVSLIPALRPWDSSGFSPKLKTGIKELIQFVEVLVIAWFVLRELFRAPMARRFFVLTILFGTGLVILIGFVEYILVFSGMTLRGLVDVTEIDSIFGFRFNPDRAWMTGSEASRNVLAAYLAITCPFLAGAGFSLKKRALRYACWTIAALGFCLILNLAVLVIAFIGLAVSLSLTRQRWSVAVGLSTCFLLLLVISLINPHHGKVLADSIAIRRTKDTYGLMPMPMSGEEFPGDSAWQQKYFERQAALNAAGYSPLLGFGIGNYQNAINPYFMNSKVPGHDWEKSALNLMERDSHGLFWVQLVETGLLGVLLFFIFLATSARQAFQRLATCTTEDRRILVGCLGAITVLILLSFQLSFLVRGIQFIGIAMLALPFAVPPASSTGES